MSSQTSQSRAVQVDSAAAFLLQWARTTNQLFIGPACVRLHRWAFVCDQEA